MRALDVATKFENLRAKQWPAFQVGFLSPPQLKNSLNNENTVKSTAFLVVSLEKVVFGDGNCQGNRISLGDPA